jgi:hypothetical protein
MRSTERPENFQIGLGYYYEGEWIVANRFYTLCTLPLAKYFDPEQWITPSKGLEWKWEMKEIEKSSENIQDLVEQSKLVFLRELATEFQERQAQYNLEEEFAKTKRNRSLLVPMVVMGIVLFFVAGAVGITLYIENRSKDVQVGVHAFEDVNLRDVLDAAREHEQERKAARR